jgi:cytochrome P450
MVTAPVPPRPGARRRRLLGRLLAAHDPATGQGLDDAEVRAQVLLFLLAGHKTTATALTFTLYLLGRHPDAQRRVRDEVRAVLGDRVPTAEDAAQLAYTTRVVKEAMRLYPPAYGPRACIGGHFALLEAVLATTLIVRAYRLTTPPDPVPLATGITLRPATSVPCTLQPIDPNQGGP